MILICLRGSVRILCRCFFAPLSACAPIKVMFPGRNCNVVPGNLPRKYRGYRLPRTKPRASDARGRLRGRAAGFGSGLFEQVVERFAHARVGKNHVAQQGRFVPVFHRKGDRVDHLAGFGCEERAAENFVRPGIDYGLEHSFGFPDRVPQPDLSDWDPIDADVQTLAARLLFVDSDARKRRVGKYRVGYRQSVLRFAFAGAEQLVANDPVVVE